jgi:hypothetical protein
MTPPEHVWYFADVDKIRIMDKHDHWYAHWFCYRTLGAIYLGEL